MFLPKPTQNSGTLLGNSYLSLWASCPRKWFYQYLYPHCELGGEVVGRGLVPMDTAPALLRGSLWHNVMEHWLRSGVRDGVDTGERSMDQALQIAEGLQADRSQEYPDSRSREDDIESARAFFTQFDERFGPTGSSSLFPDVQVVCDETGEPYVEREFTYPLGVGDYVYTCRVDAIILHRSQYLEVMEHKTSAPSWVMRTLEGSHIRSQFAGEILTLRHNFGSDPDQEIHGCLVNVLVKGWNPKSKFPAPAVMDTTTRTPYQLEQFASRAALYLRQIDDAVGEFNRLHGGGMDIESAAAQVFAQTGYHTDFCKAYNRDCDFRSLCELGHKPGALRGLAMRVKEGQQDEAMRNPE